jgi:flagellar hook-associated protein 3 FlgL
MRVTESMIYNSSNRSISTTLSALQRITEKVSSTKELNRPSDNPADVRSAVTLRDTLAQLNQFVRNVKTGQSLVSAADTALGNAGSVLQRANELAIEGANSTLDASERRAIGAEVSQLIEALAQESGTKVGNQYIFSGFNVDRAPYDVIGPGQIGAYQGDQGQIVARIGEGSAIQVNVPADKAFGPAIAALTQLAADLNGGQPVAASTITGVQSALDDLLAYRAQLGARANRLDEAETSLGQLVTSNQELLSNLEDVDMAAAVTELTKRQTTYQASLAVTAKVMQTSLLDYLK